MASARTYDEKLLSQAPEVTKADLQDGYNADLLRENNVKRTPTTARGAPTPPPRSNSDALHQPYHTHDKDRDVESSAAPLQPKEGVNYAQPRKQPWWRTVKGIAVIAVVVIVIILAAVLGGVLGSRKKGGNKPVGQQGGGSNPGSNGSGSSPVSGSAGTEASSAAAPNVTQPSTSPNNQGSSANGSPGPVQAGSTEDGVSGRPLPGSIPGSTPSGGTSPPGGTTTSNTGSEQGSVNGNGRRDDALAAEILLRGLGVEI